MDKNLSKDILATIVYYDILDYPLTDFEIWKYLIASSRYKVEGMKQNSREGNSLSGIIKELESEDIKKYIGENCGFYFLRGRENLVSRRIRRNKISQEKYKIIRRVVFWLKFIPYVRMVSVTGRMAMKNALSSSDLDLLIVIQSGKIFTGRFLVTLATQLLGKRRHARKITDRACLNYFITDGSLKINTEDLFSSSEYSFMFLLYRENIFRKFQEANGWIRNYRPNFEVDDIPSLKMVENSYFMRAIKKLGEDILDFDFLEKWLKKWQMDRILSDPRTYLKGSGVVAGDEALVFLPEPQGPEVYERFRKRMDKLALD